MSNEHLPVVWRDDPESSEEYEAQRRRVYTLRVPDRFPLAIVRPRSVSQVISAVKLAAEKNVRVAIRSGGHSWACWSVRQDSVLIDFVDFKHLSYGEANDILEASPGTIGTELVEYLTPKGRFLPGGHCATVALGGFLLQGGMGLNARGFGWAASYLQAIDVVTVKGEVLHCDKEQHSDLFWAARGAGPGECLQERLVVWQHLLTVASGFPAVVTRFYLNTMAAHPVQLNSAYIYPIQEFDALKTWMNKTLPNLHRDTEPVMHTANDPDKGYYIAVIVVARADTEAQAKSHLQVLADTRPPNAIEVLEQQPSDQVKDYAESLNLMPEHHRWVADNLYLDNKVDFAETVKEVFTSLPKGGIAFWEPMNPVSREPLEDMALSLQTDHYVALYAAYKDPAEDNFHDTWVQRGMDILRKKYHGSYLGDKDFQFHDTKYWSDEAGKKLMVIRKKWDPEGRICGYLDKGDKSGANGLSNELR